MLVIIVYFLRHGITIDSLDIGKFKVQGLYLKLDNKLTTKVDYLFLPQNNKQKDYSQLENALDRIKLLPKYFDSVVLDKVEIGKYQFRVIYKDNIIYVSNNDYELAGTFKRKGELIEGNLPLLWIKKHNMRLNGKFSYEYKNGIFAVDADFVLEDQIKGHILAKYKDDNIAFRLHTDRFASAKVLRKFIKDNKKALTWFDRVKAKSYQVISAEGIMHKKGKRFVIEPMSLKADIELQKASVLFHPKLKRLKLDKAKATIVKNVLYVSAPHPSYSGKSLDGSSFYLANFLGNKPKKIHIDIKTNTKYDKVVQKLVRTYELKLPFSQQSGTVKAHITIDLIPQKSVFKINGTANLGKGKYTLYDLPVQIYSGKVEFDKHRVKMHKIDARLSWLSGKVNGDIDLDKKGAKLSVDVARLALGDKKDPFLLIKNKHKVPVILSWKGRFRIDVPVYKTSVVFGKKIGYSVTVSDIKPLLPYAVGLPLPIKSGSIKIDTKDSQKFYYNGKVTWPGSYIYTKRGTITNFQIKGSFTENTTTLSTLGGKITYNSKGDLVKISNLFIDGKKALDSSTKGGSANSSKVHIKGSNCLIRYEKYVLLTDSFDLRINGKHTLFRAIKDGDAVRVELNGDAIVVKANRIKAPMLRALIHFGGLSGGRYSLDLHGRMNGTMKGVITAKGGVASSFKTYNNLIALFNTVPSLATLSDPGFSNQGFEIRTARIEFRIVKNRVFFDMIYIDGKSAAISGKGTVSLINGAIDMDLAIRSARSIGKIIGSIPIVGYILMGKDKSITTGVKITGTLDNPKVTTHVVLETLLAPFKMFVRTIESPAHIINN